MQNIKIDQLFERLQQALKSLVETRGLFEEEVIEVRCKTLSPQEAIGSPEETDYPILKGKEKIVEANFRGAAGHAFSDQFGNTNYNIRDLVNLSINSNKRRADFIASLNAIYKYFDLIQCAVHCKDSVPRDCAKKLLEVINPNQKVLLVGLQPRMLEALASRQQVKCIDLDDDNIGSKNFGVTIEAPEKTEQGIEWADLVLVTGSTIINGTIIGFIEIEKPVKFFGVTIAAAAKILNLDSYCFLTDKSIPND